MHVGQRDVLQHRKKVSLSTERDVLSALSDHGI
jgi:hypothetical protein